MRLSTKAQTSLNRVIEKFQAGDLSPITNAARLRLPEEAPASKWSFNNRVLAFAQTETLDCRGFRQWQQVGRNVKKGSVAAFILRPKNIKKKDENGEEKVICIGFASIAVFGIGDTEGEDDLKDYAPAALPPLADVAQRMGVSMTYLPLPPDRLADVDHKGENIRLGTTDQAAFFHELAHAAHAKIDGPLKGGQNSEQETIAEFTAAVISELYGVDHSGNAWKYIRNYAPDPLTAIMKVTAKVGQVLELLLSEIKEV